MRNISRRSFLKTVGAAAVVAGAATMTGCSVIRFVNMEIAIASDSEFSKELTENVSEVNEKLSKYDIPLPGFVSEIHVSAIEKVLPETIDAYMNKIIKNALQETEYNDALADYEVRITNRTDKGNFAITKEDALIIEIGIYQKTPEASE